MAVPRGTRFAVEHEQVFPDGAAVVGPVTPDMGYMSNEDRARGKQPKQRIDEAVIESAGLAARRASSSAVIAPSSALVARKAPGEGDG